jgi:hypothetical protein
MTMSETALLLIPGNAVGQIAYGETEDDDFDSCMHFFDIYVSFLWMLQLLRMLRKNDGGRKPHS